MYMYVYECMHIKKLKSETLGIGSTEEIAHVYRYPKNPGKTITGMKCHYK